MSSTVSATATSHTGLLERGLAILELLAGSARGMALSELAEKLQIPRSASHRLLSTLCDAGYVRQEHERGTYVLTYRLQTLAFTHLSAEGLVDAVQPVLNRLAAEVGELVRLSVIDAQQLVWVARAQGARSGLRYDPDMGMAARLSCSASGYAWLASLDDASALALVGQQGYGALRDYGPSAPQSAAELLPRLEATRALGYAVAIQTFADWMSAVAVVLRHPQSNRVMGVLSVAGPVFRLSETRLHQMAPQLLAAAEDIRHLLPGSPSLMSPQLAAVNAAQGAQP